MRTNTDVLNAVPKVERVIRKKSVYENEVSTYIDSIGGNIVAKQWFETSSETISQWRKENVIPEYKINQLEKHLIKLGILENRLVYED